MVSKKNRKNWIPVFFAVNACSWVPHLSCHYYRLETGSSFIFNGWRFTSTDSFLAMLFYSILIILSLVSISYVSFRFIAALLSGIFHLTLGILHIIRLFNPYEFEVFGYTWSRAASLREVLIVVPFGIACIIVAFIVKRFNSIKKYLETYGPENSSALPK